MAKPTVTISDIDELEKSVKDLTSLSQSLRDVFKSINRETDVLSTNFKNIVNLARNNNNLAERYLISQKLQESVQNRINEIKSKSSYLDSIGLRFKKEEIGLQIRIAAAQIRALQTSAQIARLNNTERLNAIESLKIQNVLRGAELRYLSTSSNTQSRLVRELNDQLNLIDQFTPSLERNNTLASTLKGIYMETVSIMGDFGKVLSGTLPTYKDIIVKGTKMFLEFDKSSLTLRKTFGFLRGEFSVLEKNVKDVAIELADLGVTFDNVVVATAAIGKEFNGLVAANKNLVKDVTILSAQLGISEVESVKFLKSISSMSRSTVESQKGMIGFAKAMANAAGVPLDAVMRDISDASEEVRIYTGSSVVNLIKGTVEARLMGTTFNKMADTAKKLLDFNSSINDEIEASVLLGTNVTFQRARELTFQKNILGANKEILRIAKSMNFDAMDPFQAEAFAKASGKTVAELQEMIQADKQIQYIRRSNNPELMKQLELLEQLKRKRQEEAKDYGKRIELELRQQINQERIIELQNQFNKLMMELAKPVMDVVEPLLGLATKILPPILNAVKGLTPLIGLLPMLASIESFFGKIKNVVNMFSYLRDLGLPFFQSMKQAFSFFGGTQSTSIAKFIGNIVGFLGKFGAFGRILIGFGKFLGPIGILLNVFTFMTSLLKRWEETPKGFLGGLEAIGGALYDTLIKPFKDAYDWIKSLFVGQSPSKLGLGILNGIQSVGAALLDAITAPFRAGFNIISGLFGGPKLPTFSDVINNATESAVTTPTISTSSNNQSLIDQASIINAIKQGIKEGVSNITLNVNLDGQKIVTGINKNVGFREDVGGILMQSSLV